jgi:integrase
MKASEYILSLFEMDETIAQPILQRLGIQKAELHAFRHSRVTVLQKAGTPEDLQSQWFGHSSLRTTDRYSHTNEELEYRRNAASKVGLNFLIGPNGPKTSVGISSVSA